MRQGTDIIQEKSAGLKAAATRGPSDVEKSMANCAGSAQVAATKPPE